MNLINNEHVTAVQQSRGACRCSAAPSSRITGLHMTHVIIGVIYLGIICQAVVRGKFKAEDVEVAGLYWHFVDLVWMFVFPLVYLMSAQDLIGADHEHCIPKKSNRSRRDHRDLRQGLDRRCWS